MKTSQVMMISVGALICGWIAGVEFLNFLGSGAGRMDQQATVAEFAIRLKEDATTLALIKGNRLECAQANLERRVKSMVDVQKTYQALADESAKGMLDKAVAFGSEQLRVPRLVGIGDPKTCF